MGRLNLDEILQFGGSREIIVWDASCLNKARHSMRGLKFLNLLFYDLKN